MRAIDFSRSADKSLRLLQKSAPQHAKTIVRRLMEIRTQGTTPHCQLLQGSDPLSYRSRCGDYRIVYEINEELVAVLAIGHRREVYMQTCNAGVI